MTYAARLPQPDIQFTDPDYTGALHFFDGLTRKFVTAANDDAREKFGKHALLNPSDIHLTPVVGFDGTSTPIVVEAWHEVTGSNSRSKTQYHSFEVDSKLSGEDMLLLVKSDRDDDHRGYLLTTREAFILDSLYKMAKLKHADAAGQ
jgi:hypothetical protein